MVATRRRQRRHGGQRRHRHRRRDGFGDDGPAGSTSAPSGGGGTIRIAAQKPAATLDPIAMQDLGAYGMVQQSFEFLATLGEDGAIAPGLAESWEANADGTVWTFKLREGVKWQDGTDFTSADVAATLDRLAAAGNAGLKGVIDAGSVDSSDPEPRSSPCSHRTATSRTSCRSSMPSR